MAIQQLQERAEQAERVLAGLRVYLANRLGQHYAGLMLAEINRLVTGGAPEEERDE